MFIWDVDPIAFSIGPLALRWYGLFFSGSFIIGYFMMQYMFRRAKYNTDDLDKLLVYIFAGTVIGARLAHCLIYEPEFYLSNPIEIIKVWKGGLASHGGILGVIIAYSIYIWQKKTYSFFEIADMLCVPIAFVCGCIRIGNFMNSEILGKPTDSPLGIVFARLGEDFPRYPAMLFEAAAYFVAFIIIAILYFAWKKRPHGMLMGILLLISFSARFFIEPFKEEQADYQTDMVLNVGQLLSIPFIIAALVLMFYVYKRDQKQRNNTK